MILWAKKGGLRPLALVLIGLLVLGVALHVTAILSSQFAPASWFATHSGVFDLDNEQNVPTTYNGLLWAGSAFMALLLSMKNQGRLFKIRWALISGLFFYFAFDEILVIHEYIAAPVRNALSIGNSSIFYHAWIIPAIIVTVGVGIVYVLTNDHPKLSKAQKTILKLLIILALGVITLEALGTQIYVSQLGYKLGPVLLEELFEMSMVSIILYKLTGFVLEEPETRR